MSFCIVTFLRLPYDTRIKISLTFFTDFRAKLILCTLVAMMLLNKMATSATIGSASQARQQIYRAMFTDLRHYLEHVFDTEQDFVSNNFFSKFLLL